VKNAFVFPFWKKSEGYLIRN